MFVFEGYGSGSVVKHLTSVGRPLGSQKRKNYLLNGLCFILTECFTCNVVSFQLECDFGIFSIQMRREL